MPAVAVPSEPLCQRRLRTPRGACTERRRRPIVQEGVPRVCASCHACDRRRLHRRRADIAGRPVPRRGRAAAAARRRPGRWAPDQGRGGVAAQRRRTSGSPTGAGRARPAQPGVCAAPAGRAGRDAVEMPNSDRVFHNVFSFHDGKRFDLGLYPVGTARLVTFDRPGVSRIFCNIHPNMAAYVRRRGLGLLRRHRRRRAASRSTASPPGAYAYSCVAAGADTQRGHDRRRPRTGRSRSTGHDSSRRPRGGRGWRAGTP